MCNKFVNNALLVEKENLEYNHMDYINHYLCLLNLLNQASLCMGLIWVEKYTYWELVSSLIWDILMSMSLSHMGSKVGLGELRC
jgi:hypothetical protein